mgnify:CR=1 FL=1
MKRKTKGREKSRTNIYEIEILLLAGSERFVNRKIDTERRCEKKSKIPGEGREGESEIIKKDCLIDNDEIKIVSVAC